MDNNKEGHFSLMSDEDFEKSVREEAERFERELSAAMAKVNKSQARTTRKTTVLGARVSAEKEDRPIGMKFHKFYSRVLTPLRMSLGFLGAFLLLNGSTPWPFFVGYFALAFIAIKVFVSFKDDEPYAWHFVMLYELLTIALLVYQAVYYYPFLGVIAICQPAASILIESAIIFYYAKRKSVLVSKECSNKVMETIGLPSKEIQKPKEKAAAETQEETASYPEEALQHEEERCTVSTSSEADTYRAATMRYIEQNASEELRKCQRCGALLPPFAAYCPGCGKKYRANRASTATTNTLRNLSPRCIKIIILVVVVVAVLVLLFFNTKLYVYNGVLMRFHTGSCFRVTRSPSLYHPTSISYVLSNNLPPCEDCLGWLLRMWVF